MRLAAFPADAAFLPSLAQSWLAAPGAPDAGLIILPNRRSARALAGAFLQANQGKALLLPRIIAIGAIDEAALTITEHLSLAPVVPVLTRQAILARLILARNGKNGAPTKIATAWGLAADLADLLDEAELAEIKLSEALSGLVREDLASHWQKTLEFLEIVTHAWPSILAEMGMLGPVMRQNRLLDAQSDAWTATPPAEKIWLVARQANPALQRLSKTIASLPAGAVIFPGYDGDMTMTAWDGIEDTHPQKNIALFLQALGARREEIQIWPCAESNIPAGRTALMSKALLPAASLHEWQTVLDIQPEGLTRLAARDEHEEAMAIAMALRNALEAPGQTAALITPDRGLALSVSAHLRRFGVVADDSAGEPLAETPPAILLRLLARAVTEAFAPLPFLALLKHPLTANGDAPEICRENARALEISALRGPRPAPGLDGIKFQLDEKNDNASLRFLSRLAANLQPLIALPLANNPADALRALIAAAENLAATSTESGTERLWRGEAGIALSDLLAELLTTMATLPDIAPAELSPLLDAVLAGHVIRRPRTKDGHPRIAIWGVQEASLQSVDFAILGGLVEGLWPEIADPGPWMSRPMRRQAGLPSPERNIGNTAHDFFSLCCQTPVVIFAAANRRGRAPAVPARWLTRLEALLRGYNIALPSHDAARWAEQIDRPQTRLARPKPAPKPPAQFRPVILSITDVATLINDPYAIYISKILNIRRLGELDEESDSGLFGNIVHAGLEAFFSSGANIDANGATGQLNHALQIAMRAKRPRPALEHWWQARLQRIANWVIEAEIERRLQWGAPVARALELSAKMPVDDQFTLTGRADRVERRGDGAIFIMDYKTGTTPDAKTLQSGAAPQLPLEAVMAESGAFGIDFLGEVAEIAVWKLSGGRIEGEEKPLLRKPEALRALIDQAGEKLPALFHKFANPDVPYLAMPHPDRSLNRDIYSGISRRAEWIDDGDAITI